MTGCSAYKHTIFLRLHTLFVTVCDGKHLRTPNSSHHAVSVSTSEASETTHVTSGENPEWNEKLQLPGALRLLVALGLS